MRRREVPAPWWRRPAFLWILAPSLDAAVLAVGVAPAVIRRIDASREPLLSIKGGPAFRVVARRQERDFPVKNKTALAPGDMIRFVVEPADFPYVMIASIDGAGQANVYVPFGGPQSFQLPPNLKGELPGSIVLDAAPARSAFLRSFRGNPWRRAR